MEDLVSRTKTAYERVSSFLRGLGSLINGGKSQWMMMGTRQRLSKVPQGLSVTLDGVMIVRKSTVTVLGVTIDEALSFTTHKESVCSKTACRLRLFFHTDRKLPTKYRASLAKDLIYSPLIYCDAVMCNIIYAVGSPASPLDIAVTSQGGRSTGTFAAMALIASPS